MVYYKKTIPEVSMARVRYLIRRLSVQTKSIIMGDGDT